MVQILGRVFSTDADMSLGLPEMVRPDSMKKSDLVSPDLSAGTPVQKKADRGVTFFASHLCGGAERAFTQAVLCKAELAHAGHSSITMTGATVRAQGYSSFEVEKQVGRTTGKTIGYLIRAIG